MTVSDIFFGKNRSFFHYILAAMIILVFIIVGLVVVNDYLDTKKIFEKNSRHLNRQTEQGIIAIIRLSDESYNLYDSSLNELMHNGLDIVLEEYNRSSGMPSRMNLVGIQNTLGEEFDIYIINESGIIEFTTDEGDLGLDFRKIPYFFEYLTRIRNSSGFFADRMVEGQNANGRIHKYAYMPTPDHRYVLELGLSRPSFLNDRASFKYKQSVDQISSVNPYIEKVRIFNSGGKISYNTSETVDNTSRIAVEKVLQQRSDLTVNLPDLGKSVKYLFIDLKNEQYGSDASRIVEITYNTQRLEQAYRQHLQYNLLVAILSLAVGVFGAFVLSRYLAQPISGIVRDVNRIAGGDLDHRISPTRMVEFQVLEQSINSLVSSQKSALREVQDEKAFQQKMIDHLPVAIFMKRVVDGRYTYWNKASEQVFNLPASTIIGRTDKELFGEEQVSLINQQDNEACLRGVLVINKRILSKSRGPRIIHMIIVPVFDSVNNLQLILGIGEDLTEETLTMKSDLLFSITRRDILDQLSVIVDYLERAQLKTSHEAMQMFFNKTLESIESIRNQMAFVRALQDIRSTSPSWHSVKNAFDEAVTLIASGSVNIQVDMDDIEVYADPLLPRIFYNLLTNSIKHGDHQLTKIRLHAQKSGESLLLIFEDDGKGIPLHEKEKIFEFGYGRGTGFGLFLVRELLGYTGIGISETGEPGHGATFEILVPKGKFRNAGSGRNNP